MNNKPNIDEFYERFHNMLGHVNPNQVHALLDSMSTRTYHAGEVLLHDGQQSDSLYLLWDGLLEASIAENGETLDLGNITPGQWVGEVSMLDPGPATATVTGVKDSTVLELSRDGYKRLEATAPQLTTRLLHGMSNLLTERMRSASSLLFSRYHKTELDENSPPAHIKSWLISVYQRMMGITQV